MIYIRTFAYNAQDTVAKAIESVLAQTVEDFQFYLMDNGSTDKTGEIIRSYAEKDNRIIPFYNKKNLDYNEYPEFWNLAGSLKDEDYYVALDADDYYEPTFLEEMMAFMERESLDVAACGTEFFDAESGKKVGSRVVSHPLILKDTVSYDKLFPYIHWNLRQVWGKIYSGKVAKRMVGSEKPTYWPKAYGGDTANVLTCLKYASAIGVYNKILHHYRISNKSVSYKWKEGREMCDLILYQKTCSFLLDKVGYLSEYNLKFLCTVYLYAVKDTLGVLSKAEMTVHEKWVVMNTIFVEQSMKLGLSMDLSIVDGGRAVQDYIYDYKNWFLNWTLDMAKYITDEDKPILLSFLSTYSFRFDMFFSETQLFEMMVEAPELIWNLGCEEYQKALELVEALLQNPRVPKADLIVLAQNLAALSSDEEKYIVYSKAYIQVLIECGEIERAREELTEWIELAPNDNDFLILRDKLI